MIPQFTPSSVFPLILLPNQPYAYLNSMWIIWYITFVNKSVNIKNIYIFNPFSLSPLKIIVLVSEIFKNLILVSLIIF